MHGIKLAIVGSRSFNDYDDFRRNVDEIIFEGRVVEIDEIISGGAIGADSLAERYAKEYKFKFTKILPDWESWGRQAGFRRNSEIVDQCDGLIAFWDGKSRGTKWSIDRAKRKNKLIRIVRTYA